jgi:hypothetical protein
MPCHLRREYRIEARAQWESCENFLSFSGLTGPWVLPFAKEIINETRPILHSMII